MTQLRAWVQPCEPPEHNGPGGAWVKIGNWAFPCYQHYFPTVKEAKAHARALNARNEGGGQ